MSEINRIAPVRILPEALANQIAAGEVVERPGSVVKELVENSVDAGATRIQVDIESGGKKLIRVTDNGTGMSRENAERAFARHATSKIGRPEDLEAIQTLGFRGEALPSIAAVAKVRLSTTFDENEGGTLVQVEGGGPPSIQEFACPRGTSVEVAQLFFNTPARKKFLKGDGTEFSHITQALTQQALAYPGIHFTLKHNNRETFNTLPTEQLLYRIAELFGGELAGELARVQLESGDYSLEGFVSSPVYTRASRSAQYCFINKRFVRDKVLFHATQQGYSHMLPKGRHPVIFLFLKMAPRLLDVNVHPSKAEVRFAFQQDVHAFVRRAVRGALEGNEKIPLDAEATSLNEQPVQNPVEPRANAMRHENTAERRNPAPTSFWEGKRSLPAGDSGNLSQALRMMAPSRPEPLVPPPTRQTCGQTQPTLFDTKPVPVSSLMYSEFEPLGQLDNSFIILQGKPGILVVDQHVAHERILYERFRQAAKNKKIEIQQLLFPLAVEMAPDEAQMLSGNLEFLKELGLELEVFGAREFLVRSVPAILKDNDQEQILREIVELVPGKQEAKALQDRYEDILIMMACKNAIKVNMALDGDRINKLISDLEKTQMPFTCPHGRPIALYFPMDDILRKFLRK